MQRSLIDIVKAIRSRPLAVRRTIGISVYLALTLIILTIWITSFAPVRQSESESSVTTTQDSIAHGNSALPLASPIDTMLNAFGELKAGIQDIENTVRTLRAEFASGTELIARGQKSTDVSGAATTTTAATPARTATTSVAEMIGAIAAPLSPRDTASLLDTTDGKPAGEPKPLSWFTAIQSAVLNSFASVANLFQFQ